MAEMKHGMTCPCDLCGGIREVLDGVMPEPYMNLHRRITSAMFWKIVSPQVNEVMQHAMSEAVRITGNVKGMEPIISKQFDALWKEGNCG
jgi:hypothetical protein